MRPIESEKDFQKYFLSKLQEDGYEIHTAKGHYDSLFAVSRPEIFRFLNDTQPEKMEMLKKIYKNDTEDTVIAVINAEEMRSSRLNVLKHGVEISNIHLDLMYPKPASTYNNNLNRLYDMNIFSAEEEVWASDKERIDVVLFLNGLAIMAFELKANSASQNYHDAIYQYRLDRNPETRLFMPKTGVLVCFAMDMEEVYMTTKLNKQATYFLPFNQGNGTGIYAGAGNPALEDNYSIHYMWDDVLKKDSVVEIITKFMYEKKDTVIFPRYHQRDVIRRILEDVKINKTSQNYLLQHSAGSGKTNEIAWLAYRLACLHDDDNNMVYDNVIVCTDRVVVDRQLQNAILSLEHKSGLVRTMDDSCTSADLAKALHGNTKITVTTIQKFPYIIDSVKNMQKNFAVIIDEAHSSTSGKNMSAVTNVLRNEEKQTEITPAASLPTASLPEDSEEIMDKKIMQTGKPKNVSFFAFTATPKPTTLQLFGRTNTKGQKEAFHIYSMKQAIEEGFILDVLQNYTTYQTIYRLNKVIESDPEYNTNEAKRQITKYVETNEENIEQRAMVIAEHFNDVVKNELNGEAKAMVVTSSREAAVRYTQAINAYIKRKGYDIHSLVAFSGKVDVDGNEYTEAGMNGIPEKRLPDEFDKDYQLLIVADKYQTGFDQKKLCAMYIIKKMHGVATVQTLSRLNRICPPYDKKTFVLDFENDYQDVQDDFSRYYTTTLLSNSIRAESVYDIEAKLDGYYVIDPSDVDKFSKLLSKKAITKNDRQSMEYLLQKTKRDIYRKPEKDDIITTIRHFIRCYEFMAQATCLEDTELQKKYNFLNYLQAYLKMNSHGGGFDLAGKIKATEFVQKKIGEHKNETINPDPIVNLPTAEKITSISPRIEKLSEIIAEINRKTGKNYDGDIAVKSMLQIRDILMKSKALQASAKNNSEKDFELEYFDQIDDALVDGLMQNQDFFTLLLNNDDMKHKVLGLFVNEIYRSLRAAA